MMSISYNVAYSVRNLQKPWGWKTLIFLSDDTFFISACHATRKSSFLDIAEKMAYFGLEIENTVDFSLESPLAFSICSKMAASREVVRFSFSNNFY